MSFKATIDAKCPNGCEPVETQIWSFVRGDKDENLRERLLVGELNLVLCEECKVHFSPDATVIYLDARVDLLVFAFPKSYENESAKWRAKMKEDYAQMREALNEDLPLDLEPLCLFGLAPLSALLAEEDSLEDEVLVAEHYCKELSLPVVKIDRHFARERRLPRIVPVAGKREFSRVEAKKGVNALLKANERLVAFKRWLDFCDSNEPDPPGGPK